MPSDDDAIEYAAVRKGVGLIDRSHHSLLEVTGRDGATFLHAMLSNDVKSLQPGQGCGASLLDVHGKIQVIGLVWVLEDRILVVTPPDTAAKTLEALDRHLFAEKATIRDATGERSLLVLAGPGTPAAVERVAGVGLPGVPWSHVNGAVGGVPVRVVRGGGELGETDAWIVSSASDGPRVGRALRDAGARPVGPAALEALRIEAGTPRFGADADDSVLLPEIPFASLLSSTKGCYPGQEVVVRIRDRGHVNRLLRGLVLEGDAVPARGAEIRAEGAPIGHVTSAAWSFTLERVIALGFVRRQHAEPGTAVTVAVGDATVAATVSALPFRR